MVRLCLLIFVLRYANAVPPSSSPNQLQDKVGSLKYTMKGLAVQLEKWNNHFLTSLEPRLASSASLLARIDSNINNLQERAHVWDTFQLHVSAWNDQLSTLDRKMDIISNALGKLIALDSRIDTALNLDYKIDAIIKKIENVDNAISNLNIPKNNVNHESLFEEFAAREILSTVKMVEKKLDRLLLSQENSQITRNPGEKERISIKCNTPRIVEELVKDISSKVDIIFDRINVDHENETHYELVDVDGSADETPLELVQNKQIKTTFVKRMSQSCDQVMTQLLNSTVRIENNSKMLLNKQTTNMERILQYHRNTSNLITALSKEIDKKFKESNEKFNLLKSYLDDQRDSTISTTTKTILLIPPVIPTTPQNNASFVKIGDRELYIEPNKNFCDDLESDAPSGVYVLGNDQTKNPNGRLYNERYCLIRDDGLWTVIQRRDNYTVLQNFNQSWNEYKYGFGNLDRDFWFGNEFISNLSRVKNLILRIELADFEGNHVWAEYDVFKVFSVHDNYRILVEGYRGNASDSLSSHSLTQFSTFDLKNDAAPECCPCAQSYGGGWWFNKCFESNLNGVYHREPNSNGYFRGIIWENWLGNYSLKYTIMMVKPKGNVHTSPPRSHFRGETKNSMGGMYNEEP